MTTARGSAPTLLARDTAIGTIRAVVAVFDIKFVIVHVTIKITRSNIIGSGFVPKNPTILSAIKLPAPVTSSAFASAREPPKSSTTSKSMDLSAVFSSITFVTTRITAPIHDESWMLTPISSSKIIAMITATSTASDTVCFHFGTLLKSV